MDAARNIAEQIHRNGPIRVSAFVEAALYGPGGFYATGGGAGRAGRDFITSPEVGDLFGRVVSRRLDQIWESWERPDPFFVVEAGAGRGRLAQSIMNAHPRCADALRYVLVERSAAQREQMADRLVLDSPESVLAHDGEDLVSPGPGPVAVTLDTLPRGLPNAVVLANELIDNLAFDVEELVEEDWVEVRVGIVDDRFVEVSAAPDAAAPGATRARKPVLVAWHQWLVDMQAVSANLALLLFDYGATMAELQERSPDWLRTFQGQRGGLDYLERPGTQDITIDVPFDVIARDLENAGFRSIGLLGQREWLGRHGIQEDVSIARGAIPPALDPGDFEQLKARSVLNEAAALTDPAGLGAFLVLEAVRTA
ncbi:MAG: SAM-dependent methyltransferase [Acidimicrobiia bacterium]